MTCLLEQQQRVVVWLEQNLLKNSALLQTAAHAREEPNPQQAEQEVGEILFALCVQSTLQHLDLAECLKRTIDKKAL
tara:strand:+ start:1666 stop:1896 length:231 start_codon:yes stop_codon:yes gene_type:complete